ncbi:hypothetical protein [Nocardioides campestrisoli]|uniref:hypothetical protein n=1 Tax=Nocardioides campestrisoli TaxID=2736757 RepID=UPI0015E734FC|nr:hypothetical protein [Nocardioides campestrisoli]
MRARRLSVGAAAASLVAVTLGLGTPASAAPVTSSQTVACQTAHLAPTPEVPYFPTFDWAASLTVTAQTDGTNTHLEIQANHLAKPGGVGIVPIALKDAKTVAKITATVNGTPVTLEGAGGPVDVPANAPVPVPKVSATIPGAATPISVVVTNIQIDAAALGYVLPTYCPIAGTALSWAIGDIGVDGAAGPLPTATPVPTLTASPSPTPTTKPKPTKSPKPTKKPGPGKDPEDSNSKGSPATGKVTYACLLQPFGSDFDYTPDVRLAGSRAKTGDQKVSLAASMSEIPGLAPVPIENGTMNVTMNAKMGGTAVALKGRSTVNAAPYGTVPVPTLTAEMSSSADEADVEVTGFSFAFGEMSGVAISAECTVKGGGALGAASFGVGEMPESDPGTAPGGGSPGGGTPPGGTPSTSTLPQTGSGAPLAMLGLWSSALVLAGVALFLHLPRRRQEA